MDADWTCRVTCKSVNRDLHRCGFGNDREWLGRVFQIGKMWRGDRWMSPAIALLDVFEVGVIQTRHVTHLAAGAFLEQVINRASFPSFALFWRSRQWELQSRYYRAVEKSDQVVIKEKVSGGADLGGIV